MPAAAALLLGPGWLIARAWGVRGATALGAAACLTLSVIGPATLVAQRTGQQWRPGPVATGWPMVLLVIVCAAGGLHQWWRRRSAGRAAGAAGLERPAMARAHRLHLAGAVGLAVVMNAVPLVTGTGGWDNPSQASDAVFHLSATAFVRQTGQASFLGGLAPMYDGASVYYPTGWHAVAALMPGDVVAGSNALVVVLAALVWPLGVAALLRQVLDDSGPALAVGSALAGSVVSPLLLLTSVWPYGMSVVLLPGSLALLVRAVRAGRVGAGERSGAWIVAGAGAVGVLMAHGAGAFNLAVLGLPVLVVAGAPLVRRTWARGGRPRAALVAGAGACLLVVAGAAWFMRRSLVSVFSFPRGAANPAETLFAVVTDHPLLATFTPWIPGNVVVPALAVLGATTWRRSSRVRAWTVAASAALVLLLLASGPAWPLRLLAGPWYTQRARIMPLVTLALLVLAAVGVQEAQRRWGRTGGRGQEYRPAGGPWPPAAAATVGAWARRHVPAAVLIVSLLVAPAWRWGLRTELMAAVHDPWRASYGAMLGPGELEFIRRVGPQLPADAVVLADPSNGSAYLWPVAGVRVVYPARPEPVSEELTWLGRHADLIETDPRVCQILRRHGVGYYYSDDAPANGRTGGARRPLWGQALAQVPPSALEPVDRQGPAALWRITACD